MDRVERTWQIGGQQGEKLEGAELLMAAGLCRLGYHLYGYRNFSSRIMGGATRNTLRIGTSAVRAVAERIDLLVAYDQEALDASLASLGTDGLVLTDTRKPLRFPDGCNRKCLTVPFTEAAEEIGGLLYKSLVAVGASAACFGVPLGPFQEAAEKEWGRKGAEIVKRNHAALARGYSLMAEAAGEVPQVPLAAASGPARLFMIGNEAIGLGALAAGCRFMAAYPITPATEVMEYMAERLPRFGGAVVQTEDEIAAVTMAIGASYGGVRAMTATAGPGLSLMTEAIGLASMTETPLVIVDTQRGGPSTGLPTKLEQSDVLAAIHGTHGEAPKLVLAPSTVEECFTDTIAAFELADACQCPVLLLTDLQLSLGKQSASPPAYREPAAARLAAPSAAAPYRRYALAEGGVSPRALPGTPGMLHHVTGVEHDEWGRASEDAANRAAMAAKRQRKLQHAGVPVPVRIEGDPDPDGRGMLDVLLVAMGSAAGAAAEAAERLRAQGARAAVATVRQLHPFPAEAMRPLVERARRIAVVEHNATGQLAALLRLHAGGSGEAVRRRIRTILRYDGTAFAPGHILQALAEVEDGGIV